MFLTYRESHTGGIPDDPNDRWSDCSPEYIEWSPRQLFTDRSKAPDWLVQTVKSNFEPKPGDKVTLTVVRYQTGCTFGTTHGCWEVIGAYKTREEAQKVADTIEADDKQWCEFEQAMRVYSYQKKKKPEMPKDLYEGYKPWRGYFERLEGVEVIDMTVE